MNLHTERRYKRTESEGERLATEILEGIERQEARKLDLEEFVAYCADLGEGDINPLARIKAVKAKARQLLQRGSHARP